MCYRLHRIESGSSHPGILPLLPFGPELLFGGPALRSLSSFPQSHKDSVKETVKRRSRAAHCVASVFPCHDGRSRRFRLEVTYLISFLLSRAFAGTAEASKRMEWLLTRRKEMQPPCLLRCFISGCRSGPTGQPIGNITSLPGQVKCI